MIGTDSELLTRDTAYEVLSNPRRRAILYLLRTAGCPVDVTSLSATVAGWEQEIPPSDLTSQQRKRVYVSMYQTHIPKLESVGLVAHEGETVRATDRIYEIDSFLTNDDSQFPWYYLTSGVSVFALVLLGITALFPTLSMSVAYAGVVVLVGSIGLSALGQFLERRNRIRSIPPELSNYPASLQVTCSD